MSVLFFHALSPGADVATAPQLVRELRVDTPYHTVNCQSREVLYMSERKAYDCAEQSREVQRSIDQSVSLLSVGTPEHWRGKLPMVTYLPTGFSSRREKLLIRLDAQQAFEVRDSLLQFCELFICQDGGGDGDEGDADADEGMTYDTSAWHVVGRPSLILP